MLIPWAFFFLFFFTQVAAGRSSGCSSSGCWCDPLSGQGMSAIFGQHLNCFFLSLCVLLDAVRAVAVKSKYISASAEGKNAQPHNNPAHTE